MRIGRVVGNVVSTIKDEDYYGYKLMIVEYWDENGEPDGSRVIAFDAGQAGVGDVVLIAADGGASNLLLDNMKMIMQKRDEEQIDDTGGFHSGIGSDRSSGNINAAS